MTGANFAKLIRKYTGTNTSTLQDSEIVLIANTVKDDFAPEILKADAGLFGAIDTRDLRASSSSINSREYALPQENLQIKRIEVLFDTTQSWIKLTKFNLAKNKRPTNEDSITTTFSNNEGECFYDIFRNAIWIYSGTISVVTAGLKIYHIAYPADITESMLAVSFTDDLSLDPTTTTSQLPKQFHELWARKVSIIWKGSKDKPLPLSEHEQNFERDFDKKIFALVNGNSDEEITGSVPYDDGSQY